MLLKPIDIQINVKNINIASNYKTLSIVVPNDRYNKLEIIYDVLYLIKDFPIVGTSSLVRYSYNLISEKSLIEYTDINISSLLNSNIIKSGIIFKCKSAICSGFCFDKNISYTNKMHYFEYINDSNMSSITKHDYSMSFNNIDSDGDIYKRKFELVIPDIKNIKNLAFEKTLNINNSTNKYFTIENENCCDIKKNIYKFDDFIDNNIKFTIYQSKHESVSSFNEKTILSLANKDYIKHFKKTYHDYHYTFSPTTLSYDSSSIEFITIKRELENLMSSLLNISIQTLISSFTINFKEDSVFIKKINNPFGNKIVLQYLEYVYNYIEYTVYKYVSKIEDIFGKVSILIHMNECECVCRITFLDNIDNIYLKDFNNVLTIQTYRSANIYNFIKHKTLSGYFYNNNDSLSKLALSDEDNKILDILNFF